MSSRALIQKTAVALTALAGTAIAQEAPADGDAVAIPRPSPGANQATIREAAAGFEFAFSGYVRVQYQAVFEDPDQTPFVGRNDGFAMDSARFIVQATRGPLIGYISLDGAVDRFDALNTTLGSVDVGLKDAYVGYARDDFPYLKLMVGQFKPPFDAEELQSTRDMLFIHRAVESRGLRGPEGYSLTGLSLDRQVGAAVFGEPTFGDFGLGYFVSVTNGSGANAPLNDNDQVAYTGRFEARWAKMLTVGLALNYDQRTTGEDLEDFIDEEVLGLAADLRGRFDLGPVELIVQGQFMQQSASFPDVPVEPDRVAMGYHAALGLAVPYGFTLAYRYAFYDPTSEFGEVDEAAEAVFEVDAVTHHTIGLAWFGGEALPLKLQVDYTLAQEEDGPRQIDNDRLEALVQVAF